MLIRLLQKHGACNEAQEWANDKTPQQAWETCKRADWMLWISQRIIGVGISNEAQKALWLARADCAETVLHLFERKYPNDNRVRKCLMGIRDYTEGKVTREHFQQLRVAAYAAVADADDAVADAAYAAVADAANAVADAAAAVAGSKIKALRHMADLVRSRIPFSMITPYLEAFNVQ